MTYDAVIALLAENRDERGIAHWRRLHPGGALSSYGIGLTRLRKLAKKVGRDHDLALALWGSDVYDAKVMGALIDEPKKMTRAQAEAQLADTNIGMLAHIYCSCDAALAKAPFAAELAVEWMDAADATRRRCGYLLLWELGKSKGKHPPDAFFEPWLERIEATIHGEENWVRDAMNASLLSIGKRSANLHARALAVARAIGPVEVDYGDTGCQAPDVVRHLTTDRLRARFGSAD